VKGVSEKFKYIGNPDNIRTILKNEHIFRSSSMKTSPERDAQQMAQCVYTIPCECGKSYIGEIGRPLAMQLHKHWHNIKEGFLEKTKLAKHA
jgi:hypothetical protein